MQHAIIDNVKYTHLTKDDPKQAEFYMFLNANQNDSIFYTPQSGNYRKLEGYRNPKTGLFVTTDNLRDAVNTIYPHPEKPRGGAKSAMAQLLSDIVHEMKQNIVLKISGLTKMRRANPAYFDARYKNIDDIANQLYDQLASGMKMMKNINQQVYSPFNRALPVVNDEILYDDDNPLSVNATYALPFKNPKRDYTLSESMKKQVYDFLSVFFDDENLSIFSWMMGAVFSNDPIYSKNISRFFLLYSPNIGGVGKSTLMTIITYGLLTFNFSDYIPVFDGQFYNYHHAYMQPLSDKRFVVYDEAIFNGVSSTNRKHDFKGLNTEAIKSLATTGRITSKPIYNQKSNIYEYAHKYSNIRMILTESLPVIPNKDPDLANVFLPCIMKESLMREKAHELNDMSTEQLINYVHARGQVFINYFVHEYLSDPNRYATYKYARNLYT